MCLHGKSFSTKKIVIYIYIFDVNVRLKPYWYKTLFNKQKAFYKVCILIYMNESHICVYINAKAEILKALVTESFLCKKLLNRKLQDIDPFNEENFFIKDFLYESFLLRRIFLYTESILYRKPIPTYIIFIISNINVYSSINIW